MKIQIQIELSGVVSLLYVPDCGLLAIKCRQLHRLKSSYCFKYFLFTIDFNPKKYLLL